MTDKFVQPSEFPWWGRDGLPKPRLEGNSVLFGEQIVTEGGYKIHKVEFNDLAHARGMIDAALPMEEWKCGGLWDGEDWTYDGSSQEETYETWDKGIAPNKESREAYEKMRDVIDAAFISADLERCRSAKRKRRKAWAGGGIDMARHLAAKNEGRIAPVFRTMSRRADRPVVKIGLNTSMSCNMSGSDFARIGAITACLCDKFEILGYGVEIHGISCGLWNGWEDCKIAPDGRVLDEPWKKCWATPMIPLKGADDPLDAERILSIGMAGTLRDIGFRSRYLCLGVTGGCAVPDLPDEVVEAIGLDCVVERKWDRGNPNDTADRVVGKIREIVGEV